MTVQSLDHVGIVVDDLTTATAFFVDLGLTKVEDGPGGSADIVEGEWVDRVVGLSGVREEVVMLATADGHGRVELQKYHSPPVRRGGGVVPTNTVGIRQVAFTVDNLDVVVNGLRARGEELVGEVALFGDAFKLCYVRGPEGIIVMLAEELGTSRQSEQ